MTEKILKYPLFYLVNEEIQSGKFKYILNFPIPFYSEFPCLQDKRAGISKKICHSIPYFYTICQNMQAGVIVVYR